VQASAINVTGEDKAKKIPNIDFVFSALQNVTDNNQKVVTFFTFHYSSFDV
jgi:hypothetical protein